MLLPGLSIGRMSYELRPHMTVGRTSPLGARASGGMGRIKEQPLQVKPHLSGQGGVRRPTSVRGGSRRENIGPGLCCWKSRHAAAKQPCEHQRQRYDGGESDKGRWRPRLDLHGTAITAFPTTGNF